MKKNSILGVIAIAFTIISFSSCKDIQTKDVSLNNMNDSVNYTLGHWQGDLFKQQYFQNDTNNVKLEAFIEALDAAFANKKGGELYDLGLQVGKFFNDQAKTGLFNDSALVVDNEMLIAGLVNALNDYQDVISASEADSIVQAVQQRVQPASVGEPNN